MRRASLLAVAAALVTGLLVYAYLGRLAGPQVRVALAARDLPAGSRITPEDVRVVGLPAQAVHGRAADPAGIVGRYLLADVVVDQLFLEPQLAPAGAAGPVAARLRDGLAAFFLPVSLSHGLGGAVTAGDRVDIIFVPRAAYGERAGGFPLVHGARVLELRAEDGSVYRPQGDGRRLPLGLLLEVRPDDAVQLAHALEHGSLYVMLPGPTAVPMPAPVLPGQDAPASSDGAGPGPQDGEEVLP